MPGKVAKKRLGLAGVACRNPRLAYARASISAS
jgi:hypothetical protein